MNLRQLFSGKALLILLLGVAAAVGVWYFLVTPAQSELEIAQQDLGSVQARTEALRREYAGLQAGDSNETEAAYMLAAHLDGVLQPGAAQQHREYLLAYMPQLAVLSGLSSEPATIPSIVVEGNLGYLEYAYSLSGTLSQTMAFLSQLHQLPLLTTVQGFTTTFGGTEGGREAWNSQLTVRVWWGELPPLAEYQAADLSAYVSQVGLSIQPPATTPATTPDPAGEGQGDADGTGTGVTDTTVPADAGTDTTIPADAGTDSGDDTVTDDTATDDTVTDDTATDDTATDDTATDAGAGTDGTDG